MLNGFLFLLFCLFLGEVLVNALNILVPAPVAGMLILLLFLSIRKKSFASLDKVTASLLKYLSLLFIPVAMGVITQKEIIEQELFAIVISLFLGTLIAMAMSAKLFDYLIDRKIKKESHES